MKGDSINSLLQMQAYRRADMEGQIARRDVYGETKAYVEQWRKANGLEGTKALPNRNEVPFQWMIPFLDKVETEDTKPNALMNQQMMIAQGPELGGSGRLLQLDEYRGMKNNAMSNLMESDLTDDDFNNYNNVLDTGRRQMFDGI